MELLLILLGSRRLPGGQSMISVILKLIVMDYSMPIRHCVLYILHFFRFLFFFEVLGLRRGIHRLIFELTQRILGWSDNGS